MNNPHPRRWNTPPALLLALITAASSWLASAQTTNWIAFNDHLPGAGTALNVTPYDLWIGPGGNLTNFQAGAYPAGQQLPVSLSTKVLGNVAVAGAMALPNAGTPAYNLFNGIVDLGAPGYLYTRPNWGETTLTFTNLDPSMRYLFRTTSIRGREADAPDRWTKSALVGAASFTDAHTPGIVTVATYPAASLAPNEAAWNSGRNQAAGDVVGWDNIDPGPDGSFSIVSSEYNGDTPLGSALNGPYGYGPQGFMLVEVGPATPAPVTITAQPPASTTVTQLQSFALGAKVQGTAPTYQWYKEGVGAIAGATLPTYSVASADPADSGNYYLVANNSVSTRTSTVAQVTVVADTFPPRIARVFGSSTFNQVTVEFNEPVNATQAGDGFNYTLAGPGGPFGITATTNNNGFTVLLTTDNPMTEHADYTVTIATVSDLLGNAIAAPNNSAPLHTWIRTAGSGLHFQAFVAPGANVIATLTNSPNYPNNPFTNVIIGVFDSRAVFPTDANEEYGSRIRGLFVPPTSGPWRFYVRADDPAQVFLNPHGPDPAGKVLVTDELGCCGNWDRYLSDTYQLTGGQGYYIEALHKEGTGGDYVKVAARLAQDGVPTPVDTPNAVIDPSALAGSAVCSNAAPHEVAGPILITQQPADVTVQQFQLTTLTVGVSNLAGFPFYLQWRSNGVDIAGANGSSVTISPSESVAISVEASMIGDRTLSREAQVTVVPDTNRPTVVAVRATSNPFKIIVSFSELVLSNTAVDSFNYTSPSNPPLFTVLAGAIVLDATGTNVIITLDRAWPFESTLALKISSVEDLAGNVMDETVISFPTYRLTRGFAYEQLYFNIGNGLNVSDLTGNPKYPDGADVTQYANLVEGPVNANDNYGTRLSGWLVAPVSGNYNFWMSSDDRGELWLSTDESITNLVRIAFEPEWNASRDYYGTGRRNAAAPENASTTLFPAGIPLVAGQRYFFQTLAKEASGGDNVSMAWQIPGQPRPTTPVSGAYAEAPFDPAATASLTITQQPANQIGVVLPTPDIPPIYSADFSAGDGGYTVSNVVQTGFTTPSGPWNYNAAAGSWTNFGVDACEPDPALPKATALLSPAVTLTNSGKLYVVFTHRYSFEESDVPYDGGQVRFSVNSGDYTNTVSSNNFVAYPYSRVIRGSGLLNGQAGFGGNSPGYTSDQFITSIAEVGTFNAGDVIALEFLANWDECSTALAPSWEIKSVQLTFSPPPAPVVVTFRVGATSLLNGATNSAYSYLWQRDTGAGFQDMIGVNDPTLTVNLTLADSGTRFRAIVYSPGAVATSDVATVTVTVPVAILRGNGVVTISWPSQAAGFVLQQSAALGTAASWTDVPPGTYQTTPNKIFVTVPSTSGNRFYRLIKP